MSGSNDELLYRLLAFITVAVIPRGALTPEIEGSTIMYKELTPAAEDATACSVSCPKAGLWRYLLAQCAGVLLLKHWEEQSLTV